VAEPPPAGEPQENTCPRCGVPFAPDQEYCLECGLRLGGGAGFSRTLETAWRERFGSYPGDWIWRVLLGLVVAAAGAAAAIIVADSGEGGAKPVVATTTGTPHAPTTPPATATVALPTVPSGTPTSTRPPQAPTSPPPPTTPPPSRAGALVSWPRSRNGYTVVLESIPTSAGRPFALARARAAARSGLPKVGVLDSARFSSLHAGYYVVFSGIYGSQSEADRTREAAISKGYSAAYARQIIR
jgi:hypothetical protein